MAYANPRSGYHVHPADSKHPAYFDEDNSAVLDPSILDADIMQSPNGAQHRKDSFANSNGVLSPADSHAWDHQYGALPSDSAHTGASNSYHDDNTGFARQNITQPHGPVYTHQPHLQQWTFGPHSGNGTPSSGAELMPPPAPYDRSHFADHRSDSARGSFSYAPPAPLMPFNVQHPEPGFMPMQQVQTPMSPHSHKDWMGMAQQEMESRPLPKRMRPNSPRATMVDLARRDGIRKKNGRIDIPQERNIHTIDDMIDKTSDEDLLKELKQQKRLLRNREAALASRQRKKKHTEDLEVKEKGFAQTIAGLENELAELHAQLRSCAEQRQIMSHRCHESQRIIEELREQIGDIKMQHNEETSSLRRKINVLTDQLEAGPAPAMSAAPSSTGFTDFNAEMEALNMGPHEWDMIFVPNMHNDANDDFNFDSPLEPVKQSPTLETRPSNSTIVQPSPKKTVDAAADQPVASGLLFMLLLCGAFIASKPASSQPQGMPKMPAEVCAAAPTVLSNLLSESGSMPSNINVRNVPTSSNEPRTSNLPYCAPKSNSRLDRMHHRLTSPTKQQEIDQAFSLTTAQYASIAHMDYPHYNDQSTAGSSNTNDAAPRPRRILADALASLQPDRQQGSKAEVYTRSLLWDQIPTDVVNQFKEIIRDYDEIESRQQQQQHTSHDDMFGYKVEPGR